MPDAAPRVVSVVPVDSTVNNKLPRDILIFFEIINY